jgi:hypothetical protein
MEKQKNQNLLKRYVAFLVFCTFILLTGVVLSVLMRVEVHSVGEKPPFLFALLFSVLLLAAAMGAIYLSYIYWFQGVKARQKLTTSIEQLADRFFIFRLPIYNPAFLFWFIRLTVPVAAIMLSGLFLLVLFSAF